MASFSRFLALGVLGILGTGPRLGAQQQSITLNAAPPGGFISVTAQAQAPFGAASPCYWVVPRFPIGNGPPSAPSCTPPTVGSQVLASWNAVTGATAYDLLRTDSAVLPPAGIASPVAVATAIAGTTFTDTFAPLLSYTVTSASPAMAVFFLDNQNQAMPQVRLTVNNSTSSTSFVLGGLPAGVVFGPGMSSNGFVPVYVGTSGTQLGPGIQTSTGCGGGSQIPLTGGGIGTPPTNLAQSCIPAVRTIVGTSRVVNQQSEMFICSAACTVTPISPATGINGQQVCVQNDANVATIITLAALPNVAYETTAKTGYKPINTPLVSTGAIGDQICIVAKSPSQYNIWSFNGTWN